MLEIGALNMLGQSLYAKLRDLEQIAPEKPREDVRLIVELELR